MEAKRFVLVLFGFTVIFCAALVAYNFYSMPPYGADAASLTPLYASLAPSGSSAPKTSASGAPAASSGRASSALPASESGGKTASASASASGAAKGAVSRAGSGASSAPVSQVNVNTATLAELETLPDIGPKKAQAILDYRAAHGRFTSVDELDGVKGIGTATLEKLRPYVTLN